MHGDCWIAFNPYKQRVIQKCECIRPLFCLSYEQKKTFPSYIAAIDVTFAISERKLILSEQMNANLFGLEELRPVFASK